MTINPNAFVIPEPPSIGAAQVNATPWQQQYAEILAHQQIQQSNDKARADKLRRMYPKLETPQVPLKRRLNHRFWMQYESPRDAIMRLNGSAVRVGGGYFYVEGIFQDGDDYVLGLLAGDGSRWWTTLSNPDLDMRSPSPQYVTLEGRPKFFFRPPYRQQHQGASSNNTVLKTAGEHHWRRPNSFVPLLKALSKDTSLFWDTAYERLFCDGHMVGLRLSPNVAVYLSENQETLVEYKARTLGKLLDGEVYTHGTDKEAPWVASDLAQTGLKVKS